jgi:hypothetical protein
MRDIGIGRGRGGAVAVQEECLYQIPFPCCPRDETDESPCKSKRRSCKTGAARRIARRRRRFTRTEDVRVHMGYPTLVAKRGVSDIRREHNAPASMSSTPALLHAKLDAK